MDKRYQWPITKYNNVLQNHFFQLIDFLCKCTYAQINKFFEYRWLKHWWKPWRRFSVLKPFRRTIIFPGCRQKHWGPLHLPLCRWIFLKQLYYFSKALTNTNIYVRCYCITVTIIIKHYYYYYLLLLII